MKYLYLYDHKAKKGICPVCKHRTWRTLRSSKTNKPCDPRYGVCDRINSCRHSSFPGSENKTHERKNTIPMTRITSWRCPEKYVEATSSSKGNVFAKWLVGKYGPKAADVLRMYRVGTYPHSDKNPDLSGSMVYWQIGLDQRNRSGKIIKYDNNGKRIKDFGSKWIHSIIHPGKGMDDLGIGQVLFGEHLLASRSGDPVCIVESEKSAIICSIVYPQYVWLATGGANNFSVSMCLGLSGRDVIVIPDVGMYQQWLEKSMDIEPMCRSIQVSDYLEALGMMTGDDIADMVLDGGDFAFPEIKPTEDPQDGFIDDFQREMNKVVSPVDVLFARPALKSLAEALDLDIESAIIKPLANGAVSHPA